MGCYNFWNVCLRSFLWQFGFLWGRWKELDCRPEVEVMAVGLLLGEGSVAALNRPGQKGRAVRPTGRCDRGVRELLWGLSGEPQRWPSARVIENGQTGQLLWESVQDHGNLPPRGGTKPSVPPGFMRHIGSLPRLPEHMLTGVVQGLRVCPSGDGSKSPTCTIFKPLYVFFLG